MKRCIALGVFLVLTAAPALARAQGSAADEAALRDLQKQYDAAWNASDAAKEAAFYADDAIFVTEDGIEFKGRAAIEKLFAEKPAELKAATIAGTVNTIRFIRPDLVVTQGTYVVTGDKIPPENSKGHYMLVSAKQGGSWKILALHTAAMPPPPPQK